MQGERARGESSGKEIAIERLSKERSQRKRVREEREREREREREIPLNTILVLLNSAIKCHFSVSFQKRK